MSGNYFRLAVAASCGLLAGAANAAVSVSYYSDFTDTGSGISFTGTPSFSESLSDFNIDFTDHSGPVGRPTETSAFGADFKGMISVAADGTYNFTLGADDAGYFFLDGTSIATLGGTHSFENTTISQTLTAGLHSFEVQYDNTECCEAQVQVQFDPGVTVVNAVPEASTWALMIGGIGFAGSALRRRRDGMTALQYAVA